MRTDVLSVAGHGYFDCGRELDLDDGIFVDVVVDSDFFAVDLDIILLTFNPDVSDFLLDLKLFGLMDIVGL